MRLPVGALSRIRTLGDEIATRIATGIPEKLRLHDEDLINAVLGRDEWLYALLERVSSPKDMKGLRRRAAELRFDVGER